MPDLDGLSVIEDLWDLRACMPPHVAVPKPGPCPGVRRGVRLPKKAAAKTAARPVGAPKPRTADGPATETSGASALERTVATSDVRHTEVAGKGSTGVVHKITFEDGTEAIRKRPSRVGSRTAVDQLDAEELASKLGQAVGARVPQVYRSAPGEIYYPYVDGELGELYRYDEVERLVGSHDGKRLGLLDALIGNLDRNRQNFFIDLGKGQVTGIDHAMSWWDTDEAFDLLAGHPGPFVRQFNGRTNPLTTAEYDSLRPRVMALRPEFERLGRLDWFGKSVQTFEELAARAADRGAA